MLSCYSRFHEPLIKAGEGATVLLHEATLEDDLSTTADEKDHSTTADALRAGVLMKAKHIVLTHFSQRYPKIPILNSEVGKEITGIGFDWMKVRFSQMGRLPLMLPALRKLFDN